MLVTILYRDEKAKGDQNESVLANYLETSTTSQTELQQTCNLNYLIITLILYV